jgi:dihydropteroate synthase
VAEACLKAGADWINDIWGLRADARLAGIIAEAKATVVLMHNRSKAGATHNLGALGKSYAGGEYKDLIPDIMSDLQVSISIARDAGIAENRIILDPGIGFGKNVAQNLALIDHLDEFKKLGYPLLIGPSRKSFIGQILDLPVEERDEGTAAAVAIGIARGADIIRVHNVKMMARVARMADAIISKSRQG